MDSLGTIGSLRIAWLPARFEIGNHSPRWGAPLVDSPATRSFSLPNDKVFRAAAAAVPPVRLAARNTAPRHDNLDLAARNCPLVHSVRRASRVTPLCEGRLLHEIRLHEIGPRRPAAGWRQERNAVAPGGLSALAKIDVRLPAKPWRSSRIAFAPLPGGEYRDYCDHQ